MKNSRNWIGGEWIEPTAGECAVFSPSNTKEQVGVLHLSDSSQVVQAEQAARIAYGSWSGLSGPARAGHLERMADLLESASDDVALLSSLEMGKPIAEMHGEVRRG